MKTQTPGILRAAVSATARQIWGNQRKYSKRNRTIGRAARPTTIESLEGRVLFATHYVDNSLTLALDRDSSGTITAGDRVTFTSPELTVSNLTYAAAVNTGAGDVGTAFGTISSALVSSLTNPGDTLRVAAGTYAEAVVVEKSVTIEGANAGVNPNTGTRTAETIITRPDNDYDVIEVAVDDVTIDGLTIDGDNTAVSGGVDINGADSNAEYGVVNYTDDVNLLQHLTVRNNIIQNLQEYGVYIDAYGFGQASADNVIADNKFDNIITESGGRGIGLYYDAYAQVTGNVMTRLRTGVQTGNQIVANPGGSLAPLIDSNTITGAGVGIWDNLQYAGATSWTISNNTIAATSKQRTVGIQVTTIGSAVGATLQDNDVSGAGIGVNLWSNSTTGDITIGGGTLSGNDYGVMMVNRTGVGFGLTIDDTPGGPRPKNIQTAPATFGPLVDDAGLAGNIATYATNPTGSSAGGGIPSGTFAGKIALLDRAGGLSYVEQVKNAQDAGAIAVIVADNATGTFPARMGDADVNHVITIPSMIISKADGDAIKTELASDPVHATLSLQAWTGSYGSTHPGENGAAGEATLDGVTITGSTRAGVYLRDVPNPDSSNATHTVTLHVTGDTVVSGSPVGALVEESSVSTPKAILDDSSPSAFTGNDTNVRQFVSLLNNPPTIEGETEASEGRAYHLALQANGVSGITHWIINWGDGTPDQTVDNLSTVSHLYGASNTNRLIRAIAQTSGALYATNPISVAVAARGLIYVDNTLTLAADRDSSGTITAGDRVTFTSPELTVTKLTFGQAANTAAGDVGTAFGSISSALASSLVSTGAVLRIAAGTYAEAVVVEKSITLEGANAGINPNTDARTAETIVTRPDNDYDVIEVGADDVTIDGITIDGDNTAVSGGVDINGADSNAQWGVINYTPGGGQLLQRLTVQNNVIRNLQEYGVYIDADGFGQASGGHLIADNQFDNIITDSAGRAVGLYYDAYAQVTGNVITRVRVGIQTGNQTLANVSGAPAPLIDSNTISNSEAGIWDNIQYGSATPWTISNNTITASTPQRTTGILLTTLSNPGGAIVTDNDVSGAGTGIYVWSNPSAITISGGTLAGNDYGVLAQNRTGVGFALTIDDTPGSPLPVTYQTATASFGPLVGDAGLAGNIVYYAANAIGSTANGGFPAGTFAGKIALIDRGTVAFTEKVKNAQDAGAIGVIIADNVSGGFPTSLSGEDPDNEITIPSWIISQANAEAIKTELSSGVVHATLAPQAWSSGFGVSHPNENAGATDITLDGIAITNSAKAGVYVRDVPNPDGSHATNTVAVHVTASTSVTGSPVGALVEESSASSGKATLDGSASTSAFASGNTLAKRTFVTLLGGGPTIEGKATIDQGQSYDLFLSDNGVGSGGVTSWVVNWGDGSAEQTITGNPSAVSHAFAQPGQHLIRALARLSDGTLYAANPLSLAVQYSGLRASWSLDNDAADSAGGHHDGTTLNGATFTADGVRGPALQLDGVNDYVNVPDSAGLEVSTGLTLEAWINPTDVNNYRQIISKFGTQGQWAYQIGVAPNGALRADLSGNGANYEYVQSAGGVLVAGQWAHVAATFDHGVARLYVNGTQVASHTMTFTALYGGGNTNLSIGRDPVGLQYFQGSIDEARLYDRALDGNEIKAAMDPGLVGWWKADADATDSSGQNNDGQLVNGATYGMGRHGQGFSLDGVNDYVNVPDNDTLEVSTGLTLEAWIKPSDVAGDQQIISKFGSSGNRAYQLGLTSGSKLRAAFSGTGADSDFLESSAGAIAAGQWSHVAMTFDHGAVKLFVNGAEVASKTSTIVAIHFAGNTDLSLGRDPAGAEYFHGSIDDAKIYNRPLDPTEILSASIANAGAWWKLDGDAADASGGGHNGTALNGASFVTGLRGQALQLDGVNDYVNVPDNNGLEVGSSLTQEAWINPTDVNNYRQIISKFGAQGQWAYQIGIAPGGKLRTDFSGDGTTYDALESAAGAIAAGQWTHVAMTFDHGTVKLFVNGTEVAGKTSSITSIYGGGNTNLSLGRDPVGVQYFQGLIDDAKIYDSALGASELDATKATISAASNQIIEGVGHLLHLSATGPGAADIASWTVNWGDYKDPITYEGNPSSVLYIYHDDNEHTDNFGNPPGDYTITATASDANGVTIASNSLTLKITNVAPVLTILGNPSVGEGAPYTLNLTHTDYGRDTVTAWYVDWGDETHDTYTASPGHPLPSSVTHTYTDAATQHVITAKAKDEDTADPSDLNTWYDAAPFSIDGSWGPNGLVLTDFGGGDVGRHVIIQDDGKVILVGVVVTENEAQNFGIARYNVDGSLDTTFGGDGMVDTDFGVGNNNDTARSVALQEDGKIVVVGTAGGDFGLARYNTDGSLDTTFGGNGTGKTTTDIAGSTDNAYGVIIQSDGKIVLAGSGRQVNGNVNFALTRYTTAGVLDTTFGAAGTGKITTDFFGGADVGYGIAEQSDGKLVVAGSAVVSGGGTNFGIARFTVDGDLDTSFGTGGKVTADFFNATDLGRAVAIQTDGKIVVTGSAENGSGGTGTNFALARFNSNGSLDTGFGVGGKVTTNFVYDTDPGDDRGYDLVISADGKITVAGTTTTIGGRLDLSLTRYDSTGALDDDFGVGGRLQGPLFREGVIAASMALQRDGRLIVAGHGSADFAVVRLEKYNFITRKNVVVTIGGAPAFIDEGTQIHLTSTVQDSFQPDPNAGLFYAWSVKKDGAAFTLPQGTVTDQNDFSFTPDEVGSYVVTLYVTDTDGATGSGHTAAIVVTEAGQNHPPEITVDPAASDYAVSGTSVTLNVTADDDEDAADLLYTWDVVSGPGGVTFGPNGTHAAGSTTATFAHAGTYTFRVSVSDGVNSPVTANVADAVVVAQTPTSVQITPDSITLENGDTQQFIATTVDQFGDDMADQPESFDWSLDSDGDAVDGSISAGTGVYTAPASGTGADTVRATADDLSGTAQITIGNSGTQNPTATFTNSGPVNEGSAAIVSFTGQSGNGSFTYSYDFDNNASTGTDGFETTDGGASATVSASFLADGPGTHTVRGRITDIDGHFSDYTTAIQINNVAPTLTLAGANTVDVSVSYTLSLSSSDPGQDTIDHWRIHWGDQDETIEGDPASATHVFDTDGNYTITATATDEDGTFDADNSITLTVGSGGWDGGPPTATFTNSGSVDEGWAALVSFSDPVGNGPFTYSYDLDGDSDTGVDGFELIDQPPAAIVDSEILTDGPGTHTVRGRVTDASGQSTDYSTTITVLNVAPTATIADPPSDGTVGTQIDLTGSVTDPGVADAPTLVWSVTLDGDEVDDGTGTNFHFTPTLAGSYIVTLTAEDKDAAIGTDTITIDVTAPNQAPTIIDGPSAATATVTGTVVALNVTADDDAGSENLIYTWTVVSGPSGVTFDSNDTAASAETAATFSHAGTYVFHVTVTDIDGLSDEADTQEITVAQTPTSIVLTPPTAEIQDGATVGFSATALDQFGASVASQPTFTWAVAIDDDTANGTIDQNTGLYTAPDASGGGGADTVLVIDDANALFATAEVTIIAVPTATFTNGGAVDEGSPGQVSFGDQSGTGPFTYSYDFDNDGTFDVIGSTSSSATVAGSYLSDGSVDDIVRGRITNADGAFSDYTTTITVRDVGPTLAISGDASVSVGAGYTLSLSASDPGDDTINHWTIDWGDQVQTVSGNPSFVTHTYGFDQSHAITATATDEDGTWNASNSVTVTAGSGHSTIQWDGGAGADTSWSNPLNWTDDRLPVSSDDVIIDVVANPTIHFSSGSASIHSLDSRENLTISGGSLSITGDFTDSQYLVVSSGTLAVGGTAVLASATIGSDVSLNGWSVLVGGQIDVTAGTLSIGSAALFGGSIQVEPGATLRNTGVNQLSDLDLQPGSNLINEGTFHVSQNTTLDDVDLQDSGSFEWAASTLTLSGGSSRTNTTSSPYTFDDGNSAVSIGTKTDTVSRESSYHYSQAGGDHTYTAANTGSYSYVLDGVTVSGTSGSNSSWEDTFQLASTSAVYVAEFSDGWSYAGGGSYSNSDSTGNSSGAITEGGNGDSSGNYTVYSQLIGGVWIKTGTGTNNDSLHGHWSSSGAGNYTHVTTNATGNSTVSGTTGSSHITAWDSNVHMAQTLGADGSWTVSSGDGTWSGSTTDGWTYSGSGTTSSSDVKSGTLSAGSGWFTHTGSSSGTIDEDGHHSTTDSYNIHGDWAAGTWVQSGTDVGGTHDGGHWSSSATGTYTDGKKTTPASGSTGTSTVTGTTGASHSTQWDSNADTTMALGGDASWTVSSGTGTWTGSTTDGWTYSGDGTTSSNENVTKSITGSATGSSVHTGASSGTTHEDGNNRSSDTYSIHDAWSGSTWALTGSDTGTSHDSGHFTSSATGTYTDTTKTKNVTTGSNANTEVSGTTGASHSTEWDSNSSITMALGTSGTWQVTNGNGNWTGSTDDGWTYAGDGTSSSTENLVSASATGSSIHTGGSSGIIHQDGNHHTTDHYSIHGTWAAAGSTWTMTGKDTGTAEDGGHWNSSASGTYKDTTQSKNVTTGSKANSTVSGTTGASHSTEWDSDATLTQALGSNGTWTVGAGDGGWSGSTDDGWTYIGSGPTSSTEYLASTSATGSSVHTGHSSGTITQDGSHHSTEDYDLAGLWDGVGWFIFDGHDDLTARDGGHWSSSATGSYTDKTKQTNTTTGSTANTSVSGLTAASHFTQWDSNASLFGTPDDDGLMAFEGDRTMTGSTDDGWTYNGNGTSSSEQFLLNSGGGSTSLNLAYSGGTIHHDGSQHSADNYSINGAWQDGFYDEDDEWVDGSWTDSGTDTIGMSGGGHVSTSANGFYLRSNSSTVDGKINNSTVLGNTGASHDQAWDAHGDMTQALNSGATTWAVGANGMTWTGTTNDGWNYNENGPTSSSENVSGTLTGGGTYTNTGGSSGKTHGDGNNHSSDHYSINGVWAGSGSTAGWQATSGTSDGTTLDAGHWSSKGNGHYEHAATSAGGAVSSVTGQTNADFNTNWDAHGSVTATLNVSGSTASWVVTSGNGDSVGSTNQGWNYSGDGTITDTGSLSRSHEDGTNRSTNDYSVHSTWAGGLWAKTGDKTDTSLDIGHWSSSQSVGYTPGIDGGTLSGEKTTTHGFGWSSDTSTSSTLAASGSPSGTPPTQSYTWSTVQSATNYMNSGFDRTASSASGDYARVLNSTNYPWLTVTGTASQSSVSLSSQSFSTGATKVGTGDYTYHGGGNAEKSSNTGFTYDGGGSGSTVTSSSEGPTVTPAEPEPITFYSSTSDSSSGSYSEHGGNHSSDHVKTDWTMSPSSGAWIASKTDHTDGGDSNGHYTLGATAHATFTLAFSPGGPSEMRDNNSSNSIAEDYAFSYARHVTATVGANGSTTISGSGSGGGSASGSADLDAHNVQYEGSPGMTESSTVSAHDGYAYSEGWSQTYGNAGVTEQTITANNDVEGTGSLFAHDYSGSKTVTGFGDPNPPAGLAAFNYEQLGGAMVGFGPFAVNATGQLGYGGTAPSTTAIGTAPSGPVTPGSHAGTPTPPTVTPSDLANASDAQAIHDIIAGKITEDPVLPAEVKLSSGPQPRLGEQVVDMAKGFKSALTWMANTAAEGANKISGERLWKGNQTSDNSFKDFSELPWWLATIKAGANILTVLPVGSLLSRSARPLAAGAAAGAAEEAEAAAAAGSSTAIKAGAESAGKLVGFSESETAMIKQAQADLAKAGYDPSKLKNLIKADLPTGKSAMSLSPDGAVLGDEAFSSQAKLNNALEEELRHLDQHLSEQEFGPGTMKQLEELVNENRKFHNPN